MVIRMEQLQWTNLWMPDMVSGGLERGGEKTFVFYIRADGTRQELSFSNIKEQGDALLMKLQNAGLKKGDRLAVISALRPWWFSVLYAALLGGYRMVCIDPGVPEKQIESMMRRTQVRAVLTTKKSVKLPRRYENKIPVYAVDEGFPLLNGADTVDLLLESAEELPEETFFILFSSGTTGEKRKGVLLPHTTVTLGIEYGMSTDAGVYKDTRAYTVHKRDLMLFPPYHIAGLLCAVFDLYCNTQIIMFERMSPNALMNAMQELKPDNICTVPSMLTTLMKKIRAQLREKKFVKGAAETLLETGGYWRKEFGLNPGRKLLAFVNKKVFGGNLEGFMIGGSPCDPETMRFFLNMGLDVSLAYGLTELGAPLAVTGRGYYPGTTGRVLRHTDRMDIRIVNPDEKGRGEVEVLSPYRMISYLEPEDNEGCFTEDGYFRTGDLGYFDENDCLVICGRAKEAIVLRTGEKLLPEEIETHYEDVNAVEDLCAFRVPDEGGCDAFSIAATKVKSTGVPDSLIRLHILDRASKLPPMFQPKEVYILHELPLSSSHKVQRFRLTEMVIDGMTAPATEAAMRRVDEDDTVAELRRLLVNVGGQAWKNEELTEGLLLNLDSLQLMDLFVAVQDTFGTDMFRLAKQPETFGELLDAVNNYDRLDKNDKPEVDLSQFPEPVKKSERVIYGGLEMFAKKLYNVKAEGLENIPVDGNFIICSNHLTVLDPGWICSCLSKEQRYNTAIVGKIDVMYDKMLKNIVRSQNLVPVDRTGNSLATLNRCKELLDEGWNILIFPEGTNYENAKKLMPLKEGPARLAIATGKPIVPVHIKGIVYRSIDDVKFLPKLGNRTKVCFGKPILPGDMDPAEINAVLAKAIEEL